MSERPEDEVTDADDAVLEDDRRYDSLEQVFQDRRIPLENQAIIRELTQAIGIEAFYDRGTYVKAVRSGPGKPLNIAYGWTNGFDSEEEVIQAVGDVDRWVSGRAIGMWGLWHPVHGGPSGGGAKSSRPDPGVCPTCTMELPSSGRCDYCDI
jgi:hypothetical protein